MCTKPYECSAFAYKYTKEYIEKEFEKELKNTTIKQNRYAEIDIMEWILDKDLNEAEKNPSFIIRILISFINTLEKIIKKLT
jgi:hypothetical protein